MPLRLSTLLVGGALLIAFAPTAGCSDARPEASSDLPPPSSTVDAAAQPDGDSGAELDADGGPTEPDAGGCPPAGGPGLPASMLCSPSAEWGPAQTVPITDGDDTIPAITADERTIPWFRVGGPSAELLVADRASADVPFGDPLAVAPPDGMFGTGAALSPDGLELVVVSSDARGLTALVRPSRGEPFATAAPGSQAELALSPLNATLGTMAADVTVADPVLSSSGNLLLYSGVAPEGATMHAATRDGKGVFAAGVALPDCELRTHGHGKSRRPTGMSADGLTLFYFDEVRDSARQAFRASPAAPFSVFVDLGPRIGVQTNAACDAIYSSHSTAGTTEIVREAR